MHGLEPVGMMGEDFLEAILEQMLKILALEFTPATPGPAQEELLEVFLVGGQVLFEAVCRLLVALAGPQPTEAAGTRTEGTLTCRETEGYWELPDHAQGLDLVLENRERAVRAQGLKTEKGSHLKSFSLGPKA